MEVPQMTDREPVGQAINYIISVLEIIIEMANDPATYDEVAAEEVALWRAKCRIELLASEIRRKKDEPINAKIRLVQ
jgi:hypothetical protein